MPLSIFGSGRVLALALMGSSTLAASAIPAGAETIRWLAARSTQEPVMQAIAALAAKYKEQHPAFDLQIESISDRPAYLQRVKILATSNELPEMFDADAEPYFADIVAAGLVEDVGAILDELKITDKFYKFALDYERLDDGSLNLIPWQSNTEYFFYNKSLFEKAGVEPPETLADFLATCKAIGTAGITPISIDAVDGWPIYRYLSLPAFRRTGNEFLDNLRVGKASMNDQVGIESSTFLQYLGKNCFQEGFSTTDYTTALNLFTSGQAAIYYIGTWELPSFLDSNGALKPEIGYFKMPIIEGATATKPSDFYAHSGIGTAIRAGAASDELKGFLTFLSENLADTSLYDYKVMSSLQPTIRPDLPQIYKDILGDISNVGEYAKVWDVKLDSNTVDVLNRQSQLLALGEITPQQFGAEIDKAIQQYVSSR